MGGSCSGGSCSSCSDGSCGDDKDRLPPGMLERYDLNESTADGVLVWVEMEQSAYGPRVSDHSAELLAQSRRMCDGRIFAVVFGGLDVKPSYPEIFGYGVDSLYHVRDRRLETYMPEAYAECICEISRRVDPSAILMSATPRGREVAPRVAACLQTGLTADCTDLRMEGRELVMTRPAFGGSLLADIRCRTYPQMATVRPGVFERPPKKEAQGTVIYWQYSGDSIKDVLSDVVKTNIGCDIRDAKVLISLGNGVRSRDSVELAEAIASKIGAKVSCSRSLVEKGWMSSDRQVGMSGRTVAPDLYIAFGISGAIQHRMGMQRSKRVIAVNTDADAPIHKVADLSLIADADEVLRSWASGL